MKKFGIGENVLRKEDNRLLTGNGLYMGDIHFENQVHAYVLRSPHANAKIISIDTSNADSIKGVIGIYTSNDIGEIKPLPCAVDSMFEFKKRDRLGLIEGLIVSYSEVEQFAETLDKSKELDETTLEHIEIEKKKIMRRLEQLDGVKLFNEVIGHSNKLHSYHSLFSPLPSIFHSTRGYKVHLYYF